MPRLPGPSPRQPLRHPPCPRRRPEASSQSKPSPRPLFATLGKRLSCSVRPSSSAAAPPRPSLCLPRPGPHPRAPCSDAPTALKASSTPQVSAPSPLSLCLGPFPVTSPPPAPPADVSSPVRGLPRCPLLLEGFSDPLAGPAPFSARLLLRHFPPSSGPSVSAIRLAAQEVGIASSH